MKLLMKLIIQYLINKTTQIQKTVEIVNLFFNEVNFLIEKLFLIVKSTTERVQIYYKFNQITNTNFLI